MHEFALADEIARIVERKAEEADLVRVSELTLTLGTLSFVDRDSLAFALEAALRGGIAEGARIGIEALAARARCPACGLEQGINERFDPCSRCGAYGLEVLAGTELRLSSLEGFDREE